MERKEFFEEVVRELNERGFSANYVEVEKNGVALSGVTVGEGSVKPNIYLNKYYEDSVSVADTVDKIINIVESNKPDFDLSNVIGKIQDENFVKDHIKVVCSKADTYNDCINQQKDGITLTMVIQLTDEATVRVKPELLAKWSFTEEELWEFAKANNEKDVVVKGMFETMQEIMGDDFIEDAEDEQMYVVTNASKCNGAYTVFTDKAKAEIKRVMKADKVVIIPSSIHECLVVPYKDDCMEEYTNMVKEVNRTQVAPEEVLSDTPFVMAI